MRQTLVEFEEYDEGFGPVGGERAGEDARPPRRLPAIVLAVLAMAVFAGGLWFAYEQGRHHAATGSASSGGVPLLRADSGPTKVKPEQPGGMQIPDQNVAIYNEKPGGPAVENLLPPPEQPMPRPVPEPPPPPAAAAAPAAPVVAAPPTVAAAPPPPAQAMPEAAAAKPAPHPKSEAPPAHAAKTGPVRVQLASLRSVDAARAEWARLKHDYADLLGSMTAVAVRADLGDKGIYYRVEAGPLDAAAAERLCGELRRRKLGCALAR